MERQEREMELWERTYDRAIQTSSHEGATLQANDALKAFREAFPGNPVIDIVRRWEALTDNQRAMTNLRAVQYMDGYR